MIRLPNGKITIARGPDGAPVGVLDVPRGRKCGCYCPECGGPVIAKLGPRRAGHFAHASAASACTGMGAWHRTVRDLICQLEQIDFGRSPAVPRLAGVQKILRTFAELPVLDNQFRVDAILELQAGVRIAVEVIDSHDIPALKLAALLQDGWLVLRVDVPKLRAELDLRLLREALPLKLEQFGRWQSWPMFHRDCSQLPLRLENTPRWLRILGDLGRTNEIPRVDPYVSW